MKFKLHEDKIEEVRLNNHQQHFEDLVLFGREGLEELNDKIDKFIRRFESQDNELNLTQKIDGAPALFCWSKFPGYPDNSIALKGFTSGPNTAMSSEEQIDQKYGDRPDMAAKLKLGLELARYIPKGECWQGDCLFSHDDIREEEINGQFYLTFQPNKIVYAFKEPDPNYEAVRDADFGIAFHTIYRSAGNGEKSQSFDIDPTRIHAPSNFYIMSPAINASKSKDDYSLDELEFEYNYLKQLEQQLLKNQAYEELVNNQTFMNYWNTFENANLADKKKVNLDVASFLGDLKTYVKEKQTKEYDKKMSTLKTDKGRQGATDKYNRDVEELANIIETNKSTLTTLVKALNTAANIKMLMWEGLRQAKNDYSTFYKSRTKGYIPAEGEGIAMSDNDGNIVKIVDRSTFSSYNRDPDIMSGFEHESLDMINHVFNINEDLEKTAVVAFGRMNPPTIGHRKLAELMAKEAAKTGERAKIYVSHSVDSVKNPLSYDRKLMWCKKAFGDIVDVVESNANSAWEVLTELWKQGYTDIIYAGGDDRMNAGKGNIFNGLVNSNKKIAKKTGKLIYDFNSITPLNAGDRNPDSNDPSEQASASLVRKLALENNFNEFKKYVPFDSNNAFALYKELRKAMTGNEESFLEACNSRIQQLKEASNAAEDIGNVIIDDNEYILRSNMEIKMGPDHYISSPKWKNKDTASVTINSDQLKGTDKFAKIDTYHFNRVKFICNINNKNIILKGVKGSKSKGFESEDRAVVDGEMRTSIINYIANEYKNSNTVKFIDAWTKDQNPPRNVSINELFGIKNLYKPKDKKIGERIADCVFLFNIDNKEVEFYISNKFGTVHTPINAGITNIKNIDDLLDPIINFNNLSPDEKYILKYWWDNTNSSINNVEINNNGEQIKNWYYIFNEDAIKKDNIINFLANQYGSGYYYVVEDNKGNVKIEDIDKKVNLIRKSKINGVYATLTHSMFAINSSITLDTGEVINTEIDFRRKSATNYSVLSKHTSQLVVNRQGIRIKDLDNIKGNLSTYLNK